MVLLRFFKHLKTQRYLRSVTNLLTKQSLRHEQFQMLQAQKILIKLINKVDP